jgi:hypothetical protein
LHFLGAKLILTEFAIGAARPVLLGIFSVWQSIHHFHSAWLILFGVHLILGISYVPLLLHEIDIFLEDPPNKRFQENCRIEHTHFENTAASRAAPNSADGSACRNSAAEP